MKPIAAMLSWCSAHAFLALLIVGILLASVTGFAYGALALWLGGAVSLDNILFLGCVCCVGMILGYAVNRAWTIRTSRWIWILGLGWVILGVRDGLRSYDPRWHVGCTAVQFIVEAFFVAGRRCGGGEDALYGLVFTMPALGLAGCSAGACIAGRRLNGSKVV